MGDPYHHWRISGEVKDERALQYLKPRASRQQIEACQQALREGYRVWAFNSLEQAHNAPLTRRELALCAATFARGCRWAGIIRAPESVFADLVVHHLPDDHFFDPVTDPGFERPIYED
ncbi:MAG: hypothetical protein A3J48_04685 [Candidatus Doudnabacteria bacterium RIFCSPHIGHO2_02_FULL_46_11]|uniref:Uncharacterized protein n=1 Tax=Candidatus Doudnabacteria bacterium RIFCSPHIGHO2_02_FULL_46_11 TaxID=1817832 RepID=A0A1F5P6X0_9BACT|nr:MAG: hypothetical protein A3J48_04685 [Candidatus Doudnabacteria bacterium RIFCSPHIGHO2_02_FULL_46_11]